MITSLLTPLESPNTVEIVLFKSQGCWGIRHRGMYWVGATSKI
uniref:Uncharacterized protein n=1 Tax=Anguilla anguilla TaxID=7936 RepID=A0A0E9XDS6_ANGAN